MAKPLSDKSKQIREAIEANADQNNHQLAELLSGRGVRCTASDVYKQRLAMKALEAAEAAPPPAAPDRRPVTPAEAIRRLRELARDVGGMGELRLLMDVLEEGD